MNKNNFLSFFRVFVWTVPIIFGAALVYYTVQDVPEIQARVSDNTKKIADNDKKISLVERDIVYIREGIDDIKRAVRAGSR